MSVAGQTLQESDPINPTNGLHPHYYAFVVRHFPAAAFTPAVQPTPDFSSAYYGFVFIIIHCSLDGQNLRCLETMTYCQ